MKKTKQDSSEFNISFAKIEKMFSKRIKEYGDGPECAEHSDRDTQEKRMELLAEVGHIKNSGILDFGCATGHLNTFMKREYGFEGEYTGYDLSAEMIQEAQIKHPESNFEVRNILEEGVGGDFDYVMISGTFNDQTNDNWDWMRACLKVLFRHTRRAMAFNNLSTYVDYRDDHLFYVNPEDLFKFCKEELSPLVTLRHDYSIKEGVVPYEFSTYVYATPIASRKRLN